MSTTSNLDAILQKTLSTVSGLSLTLNSTAIPAAIAKLPRREATVDPAVQIVICMHPRGEKAEAFAFSTGAGLTYKVDYPILIVLIAPNNDDQVANLQQYAYIRQTIRQAFADRTTYTSLAYVWDVTVEPEVFLDRKQIPLGYDYMATLVMVTTQET